MTGVIGMTGVPGVPRVIWMTGITLINGMGCMTVTVLNRMNIG